MDASGLVPLPDPIPVPWGWFKVLLILTFVLHLILMNLMLGGGLLAFFRLLRGGNPSREAHSLPTLIALTINLGVPPLLFLQVLYGHLFYTSSVLMAVWWISVIPVLIVAYYAAYGFVRQLDRGSGWPKLWLGASSLLLLAVGFMLTNNMTLMLSPERWTRHLASAGGTLLNLTEPTLFPRYLHFVTASIAVAALGGAVYHRIAARRPGGEGPTAEHGEAIASGLKIFAVTTMVQVVLGVLFWVSLPGEIGKLFLGGSLVHSLHLWLAIVLALLVIFTALRGRLWLTTGLAALIIVLMVVVRDLVRSAYLAPYFQPRDLEVIPQVSPLIVFVVSLLAVVGVLVWILRRAWLANVEVER
jgi:hypothetical protein